jgi:hypothetical protein
VSSNATGADHARELLAAPPLQCFNPAAGKAAPADRRIQQSGLFLGKYLPNTGTLRRPTGLACMPRFYFHVDDGHLIPDRDGFVLPISRQPALKLSPQRAR